MAIASQFSFLRLFSRFFSRSLPRSPELPHVQKRSILGEEYTFGWHPLCIMDIQTYVCSVSMLTENSDHAESMDQRFQIISSRTVSERDQKQDGDQPVPERSKPGTSKKEKPEREFDKGAQRVKRPKKRIGMPPPPNKQERSRLLLILRKFC